MSVNPLYLDQTRGLVPKCHELQKRVLVEIAACGIEEAVAGLPINTLPPPGIMLPGDGEPFELRELLCEDSGSIL